jgi:hypothetical protein
MYETMFLSPSATAKYTVPLESASLSVSAPETAIAASTAFPPCFKISSPASAAKGLEAATMPRLA